MNDGGRGGGGRKRDGECVLVSSREFSRMYALVRERVSFRKCPSSRESECACSRDRVREREEGREAGREGFSE